MGAEGIKTEVKEENIVRITITKEADYEADKIVALVNDGFDGGRISKQDLASWILTNFTAIVSGDFIEKVRFEFFNELVRFKNLLKLAQQSGGITPDIRRALKEISEDAVKPRKQKKTLIKNNIIDMVKREDAA